MLGAQTWPPRVAAGRAARVCEQMGAINHSLPRADVPGRGRGCPPCALAERPIPLRVAGAPRATAAPPSITAPRPHPGKSGLPAAPHPSTGMQVTPCPSRHCHLTRGGCVCVSAPSREVLEHGNAYCRVNPTRAQGEWESCPTLRQKLAVSTQMKLHYSELLGFSTES